MNKVAAVRGTRSLHDRAMHARGVVAILTKPFTRAHVAMHTRGMRHALHRGTPFDVLRALGEVGANPEAVRSPHAFAR
jgi:hypothetical protein